MALCLPAGRAAWLPLPACFARLYAAHEFSSLSLFVGDGDVLETLESWMAMRARRPTVVVVGNPHHASWDPTRAQLPRPQSRIVAESP